MKVTVILGTRPEIIKFSPVIEELEREDIDYFVIHSGQHYSPNMDKVFFHQLSLPSPKYSINVGSGTHGESTGKMLIGIEKILINEKPDIVLVQGDTNTTLAGALSAVKLLIKVGHIEAGLRSFNKEMPEEINRVMIDHISDYLFVPTDNAKRNLLREGIERDKIFVTGNTIVDAIIRNLKLASKTEVLEKYGLKKEKYFLVTIHRQENVDRPKRFSNILKGLTMISEEFNLPIVYPIHPRAKKRMREYNLKPTKNIRLLDPIDYLSFLRLEKSAKLVLSDSGGVQEEACILKVPCVTLRYDTERPETLKVGANILAGTEPKDILEKTKIMLGRKRNWSNPFGDGKTSKRIIRILKEKYLNH